MCNSPNKHRWLSEQLNVETWCKGRNTMSELSPFPAVCPIGFQLRGGYLRAKIRMKPKKKKQKQPERKSFCSVSVWHIYTLATSLSTWPRTSRWTRWRAPRSSGPTSKVRWRLSGVIHSPQREPSALAGNIPGWLQGTLLRNGPGIFSVGDNSYQHWFDGMAIMHSFTFRDGSSFFFF